MSDDLLKDAASALRGEAAGRSPSADATRMRVVGSIRAARRRRVVAVRASAVLLCAALGGTAWAAATGRLPSLPALAQLFGAVSSTEGMQGSPPGPAGAAGTGGAGRPAPEPSSAPPPEEILPADADTGSPGGEPGRGAAPAGVPGSAAAGPAQGATPVQGAAAVQGATPAQATGAAPVQGAGAAPAASGASAAGGARGDGSDAAADALYQRAHALHFGAQDHAGALAAWDSYLAAAPGGRFATFAHYNRALCLLRLGRTAEARRALQLFASGAFGGYRRAEAQSLLDAMDAKGD